MKLTAILLTGLAVAVGAMADTREATRGRISEAVLSDMQSSLDTEATIRLSAKDRSLARQWMLSDADWVKYLQIMSGPRGIWSPGLDPITALGVSETDPRERQRYAALWIRMESRRIELEMAFEVERQRAASRVLGNQPAVNNAAWIEEWERKRVAINKRVMLFVDPGCREDCKSLFESLQASVGDNARLDVFFRQGVSSEDIGQWAAFMQIPPQVVRAREITLNFDDGKSAELDIDPTLLPQVRVADLKTGTVSQTYP